MCKCNVRKVLIVNKLSLKNNKICGWDVDILVLISAEVARTICTVIRLHEPGVASGNVDMEIKGVCTCLTLVLCLVDSKL